MLSTLRFRHLAGLVAVALLVLTGCLSPQEQSAMSMLNDARAGAGLAPLATDGDATTKAQQWAVKMAAAQEISHSNVAAGIGGSWQSLGENVAAANTVEELHSVLMGSANHRSRILDGRFTHVGIGIARGADGRLYTAQVFVRR